MSLFPPYASDEAQGLLRQEFLGNKYGQVVNLRHWVSRVAQDADQVSGMIDRLYSDRMAAWHPTNGQYERPKMPFSQALDRWGTADLDEPSREIGRRGLERSLSERVATDLQTVFTTCDALRGRVEEVTIGPVHGDLHSQNVLVSGARIELIDYEKTGQKWRALDFLMLECSLKFLVAPAHVRLADLLEMEERLEPALSQRRINTRLLEQRMYGRELCKIAAAVACVRRQALRSGAVEDGAQYRRGLVLMTAGLAGLPDPINRIFLFHSLAWHALRVG
jgi:hypothetical protein